MKSHAVALGMSEDLEEASDDNLLHFFRPELIRVWKGAQATSILSESVVKRFHYLGLLSRKTTKAYELSDKARSILQNTKDVKTGLSTP